MKKTRIITISLLGLLLLVPFMTPTIAAPAAYVPVAEEEEYLWELNQYNANFGQFFIDNMSDVLGVIFAQPAEWQISTVYSGWSWDDILPQSSWPLTVKAILPENTSALLSDYFIFDNITYTPVFLGAGYNVIHWPPSSLFYDDTWYIVNDTASFAKQSIYGSVAFSPYTLMGVPFGPKNINWTEFVGWVNWGMGNFWTGDAVNTTATALSNGYSLSVPASGFGSNTLPITINVTYSADGILNNCTFEYGTLMLFFYELVSYTADAVNPVITDAPSDLIVDHDYTGESFSWTATDANPGNYTITRDATPVVTATPWVNGTPVVYNIPDGLTPGTYTFQITFEDIGANVASDSVVMTINAPDTTDPVITDAPSDLVLTVGATGQSLSWTATDEYAGTYTIRANGSLVVVTATPWVSGTPVIYNIPDFLNLIPGVSTYEITFSDSNGNTASDSVTVTVNPPAAPATIPGYETLIVIGFTSICIASLVIFKKKRKYVAN